ncbi:MAG: dihydroorotase [Bacteroidota bacterium]|nr:dihydroorotase [Bacteroidota bacterium]
MSLLLNSLVVSDSRSKYHNSSVNILISSDGKIKKISKKKINVKAKKTIDLNSCKLSAGWVDFSSNFCDPGYEYKEDLISGVSVASSSGFTEVVINHNTHPVIQNKNDISYIKNKSLNSLCSVYPTASVTKNSMGVEMNDLIDLHHSGAIAFCDSNLQNSELILNVLIYLKQFNGLYISKPKEPYLSNGVVNDGLNSNTLGLKSIPNISESIIIERDISLLKYSGGRIHFSGISTKEAVDVIRKAKKSGLDVTCDVPIYNLLLDDEKILDFNTNFKVYPPLRSQSDIDELIRGLEDGTIDVISSHHQPQDIDSKNCEFEKASFGIISLQTFYSNLVEISRKIPFEILAEKITTNPRKILGIKNPEIKEGSIACFTVFDEMGSWDYNDSTNQSKSKNSPWMDWSLRGKVRGVVNGNKTNII